MAGRSEFLKGFLVLLKGGQLWEPRDNVRGDEFAPKAALGLELYPPSPIQRLAWRPGKLG